MNEKVASEIFSAKSNRDKGCPRSAFLGLCEEGLIKGIPAGEYTASKDNKSYALKAIQILKNNPEISFNKEELWNKIMKLTGKDISHNHQLDVVITLSKKGLIDI